jgi:hypothetical protein
MRGSSSTAARPNPGAFEKRGRRTRVARVVRAHPQGTNTHRDKDGTERVLSLQDDRDAIENDYFEFLQEQIRAEDARVLRKGRHVYIDAAALENAVVRLQSSAVERRCRIQLSRPRSDAARFYFFGFVSFVGFGVFGARGAGVGGVTVPLRNKLPSVCCACCSCCIRCSAVTC